MQPLSFHTALRSAPCSLAFLHHSDRSSWSLSLLRIMKTVNYSTKLHIVSRIFFPSNEDMIAGVMSVSTRCWKGSLRGARSHPNKAETVLFLFLQVTFSPRFAKTLLPFCRCCSHLQKQNVCKSLSSSLTLGTCSVWNAVAEETGPGAQVVVSGTRWPRGSVPCIRHLSSE